MILLRCIMQISRCTMNILSCTRAEHLNVLNSCMRLRGQIVTFTCEDDCCKLQVSQNSGMWLVRLPNPLATGHAWQLGNSSYLIIISFALFRNLGQNSGLAWLENMTRCPNDATNQVNETWHQHVDQIK